MKSIAWLAGILVSLSSVNARAASIDCAHTLSANEKLICSIPSIAKLELEMGRDYQAALNKAEGDQKNRLALEQDNWVANSRNVCQTETCLRHAYWSRMAEVLTYNDPKSPLYAAKSNTRESIQKFLGTMQLSSYDDRPICRELIESLKQMRDIQFVDPVVQAQTYSDPAFEPWKKKWQCEGKPPLHFAFVCDERASLGGDFESGNPNCLASYGLPPFRLYELPSTSSAAKKNYIFFSDDDYAPMNQSWREGARGHGDSVGFRRVKVNDCTATPIRPETARGSIEEYNYKGIFRHLSKYYLIALYKPYGAYRVKVVPAAENESRAYCEWSPKAQSKSVRGNK